LLLAEVLAVLALTVIMNQVVEAGDTSQAATLQPQERNRNLQNPFQALAQRVRSTSNTGGNINILNIGNATIERSKFEVNLKLFPNPNNGNFVLQNADGSVLEKGQVEIFDLAARKVAETMVQSNGIIELNEVSNGVYYVKYSNAKSSKTLKMMVQKGE
jgi:hypothetical protein